MLELSLEGYRIERLDAGHAAALQDLYERCSDYHELEEGRPTRPGAARHLLSELPPGKVPGDKFVLGIRGPGEALVGVLDLIRDYPEERAWWLGLLMLDPGVRGRALGGRVLGAAEEALRGRGARSVYLGVLEHNVRGERFWRRRGFAELHRQAYTSATGHPSRVIVMRRDLEPASPENT